MFGVWGWLCVRACVCVSMGAVVGVGWRRELRGVFFCTLPIHRRWCEAHDAQMRCPAGGPRLAVFAPDHQPITAFAASSRRTSTHNAASAQHSTAQHTQHTAQHSNNTNSTTRTGRRRCRRCRARGTRSRRARRGTARRRACFVLNCGVFRVREGVVVCRRSWS